MYKRKRILKTIILLALIGVIAIVFEQNVVKATVKLDGIADIENTSQINYVAQDFGNLFTNAPITKQAFGILKSYYGGINDVNGYCLRHVQANMNNSKDYSVTNYADIAWNGQKYQIKTYYINSKGKVESKTKDDKRL